MSGDDGLGYGSCRMCEHRCGADRTQGPAGACCAGADPRVFCELLEYAEEPDLVPAYAVSFSGCNHRCAFCITGLESQDAAAGQPLEDDGFVARARRAVADGARSVLFLGGEPTIWLPHLTDLAGRLEGIGVPRVVKTNLYGTEEAVDALCGPFEVILADFKFGSDACARRLAGVPRYVETLRRNLRRASLHRRVIVRHLVMPGHHDCCLRPVVEWVLGEPRLELSVRDHYVPTFRAGLRPEINRSTTEEESAAARSVAGRVA